MATTTLSDTILVTFPPVQESTKKCRLYKLCDGQVEPTDNESDANLIEPFIFQNDLAMVKTDFVHELYQWDLIMMCAMDRPVTKEMERTVPWIYHHEWMPVTKSLPLQSQCIRDAATWCQSVFSKGHFSKFDLQQFWPKVAKVLPDGDSDKQFFLQPPLEHGFVDIWNENELSIQDKGDFYKEWYSCTLDPPNMLLLQNVDTHALDWRQHQVSPAMQLLGRTALICLGHRVPFVATAVAKYINHNFQFINGILRRSHTGHAINKGVFVAPNSDDHGFLFQAISVLPPILHPCTVYRHLKGAKWLTAKCQQPGDTVAMNGFISTSMVPRFLHTPKSFVPCEAWLEIRLPVGTPCGFFAGANDEREVALQHGLTYRLESRTSLTIQKDQKAHTVEYMIFTVVLTQDTGVALDPEPSAAAINDKKREHQDSKDLNPFLPDNKRRKI